MGPGGCLGMELDGHNSFRAVPYTRNRSVIQMPVSDLQFGRQPFLFNRIAVILRGDDHTACPQILNRLIRSTVAELQLKRARAESQREDLVAQTDAEDGLYLGKAPGCLVGLSEHSRVTGAIGEKDAIGVQGKRFLSRSRGRDNHHTYAVRTKESQDVTLHTEVVEDNQRLPPLA